MQKNYSASKRRFFYGLTALLSKALQARKGGVLDMSAESRVSRRGLSVHGDSADVVNFEMRPNGSLRFTGGGNAMDTVLGQIRGEIVPGTRRRTRDPRQTVRRF